MLQCATLHPFPARITSRLVAIGHRKKKSRDLFKESFIFNHFFIATTVNIIGVTRYYCCCVQDAHAHTGELFTKPLWGLWNDVTSSNGYKYVDFRQL